jgi:ABC-type Zn uptake system ZnuABC Zn-binding protein ZnuA
MRQENIKIILMESFYPRSTVELVAQKAGARALVLPSDVGASADATDYVHLVDAIVRKLTQQP